MSRGSLLQSLTLGLVALVFGVLLVNLLNPPKPPAPPKVEVTARSSGLLSDTATITPLTQSKVRLTMGDDDRLKVKFETGGTIALLDPIGADLSIREEVTGTGGVLLPLDLSKPIQLGANKTYTVTLQCPRGSAREIMLIAN